MCAGGIVYGIIELIWRGYTHWTMIVLGGVSLMLLYCIEQKIRASIYVKCLIGSFLITAAELITGLIVNKALGWEIWDYSDMFLNIAGQICPLFSIFWFILCIPGLKLAAFLHSKKRNEGDCFVKIKKESKF